MNDSPPDTPQCEHSHTDPHDFVTCQELAGFLDDYIDGKLPDVTLEQFEEHLSVCPPCVDYIESYKQTVRLARRCLCEDAIAPPPTDVPASLISAIMSSRTRPES